MIRLACPCSVGIVLGACVPALPAEGAGEAEADAQTGPSTEAEGWTTQRRPPLPGTDGTEGTTQAGATSSDGGPGFIEGPDGSWGSFECSIWERDCPRGEKCLPFAKDGGYGWNASHCVPIADAPGQQGDPCTAEAGWMGGVDDCDIGLICWPVQPVTNEGYCVAFCMGSENNPVCDDPDYECQFGGQDGLALCILRCDPVAQDCPDGEGCYPYNGTFGCVPDAGGDNGAYADPCLVANVCDPGLACVDALAVADCNPANAGCCTPFCDLAAPDCPGSGNACVPWYERGQAPPGYEQVGICLLQGTDGAPGLLEAGDGSGCGDAAALGGRDARLWACGERGGGECGCECGRE